MKPATQWLEDNRFEFTTIFSFDQVAKLMDCFLKDSLQEVNPLPSDEDIENAANKVWKKSNPTFGMNPYYSIGFLDGAKAVRDNKINVDKK